MKEKNITNVSKNEKFVPLKPDWQFKKKCFFVCLKHVTCMCQCCNIITKVAEVRVNVWQNLNFKTHAVNACSNLIYQKWRMLSKIKSLKQINEVNCLNTNIYSLWEASGGQSSNLYSNIVKFFNTIVN